MNNKFKNYGLWVSIFSLIGLILQNFGLLDSMGITNDTYQNIVQAVLAVLTAAGIISNPSIGNGYKG